MKFIETLYRWYGKKKVWSVGGALFILVVVGAYIMLSAQDAEVAPVEESTKIVVTKRAGELSGTRSFSAVGTVTAVSEARLLTESSGRVTAVYAGIGDSVSAGTVLAQLENASERATLLQAEGAYESALASGEGADIGLSEARVGAQNAYRTAFTVVDDTIRNLTDELFSNPTTASPGLRLDGQGAAPRINAERVTFETMLADWERNVDQNIETDTRAALDQAERDLTTIGNFVSELSMLLAEQDPNTSFTEDVIASYKARLSGARTRIDGTLQTISGARNALLQAEKTATNGGSSESDARIKQALGGLRSAQAAYEKTLVRTPIGGVVNAFYLKANENVGMGVPAATVANNGALEITTSISDADRGSIAIGDSVTLDGNVSGTITRIAPAIDPNTGKVEVRIGIDAVENVKNGDTLTVTFTRTMSEASQNEALVIPISAFKIMAEGPVAFTVDHDSKLVAVPVVLGAINGDMVVVREGLSPDSVIVTDARGLKAGEMVTVSSN